MPKAPTKAAEQFSWAIYRIRKKQKFIGTVEAPDEE
jgi:hypothetical protein